MEPTTVEKTKNPKRVEQGKKLAEHNRERREREREERKKLKEQETWKKQQKDEPLTIQDNSSPPQPEKSSSKVLLPVLALTVIGVGVFCYFRKPETKVTERSKTKFVDRLEKYQK